MLLTIRRSSKLKCGCVKKKSEYTVNMFIYRDV